MKKHLAILCGIFYPEPSATGLCVKRFAELLSDEYEIDLICLSENEKTAEVDIGNGIRIHKLSGRRISAEAKSQGIVRKMIHFLGGIQIKTMLLGNLGWYRTAAYRKLEEIHGKDSLDAVLSVCSPFAAHCAALDFKRTHLHIRWCGYTVDPYAAENRIRPLWCSFQRLVEEERSVIIAMDAALLSEEVYQTRPELYQGCTNAKALPYMLPGLSSGGAERRFFVEEDINCVYAGSFYRDIRNPECMLQAFAQMDDPRIKLHLFSSGCEDIVGKYAQRSSAIVVHPRVTAAEMAQVYRDADVLVNIENSVAEFMPSKTFEYIATGKPIVNFFWRENDREILGRYPLCFQLPNSSGCADANKLCTYILMNGKNTVPNHDVLKIYSKYSRENISEILHSALLQ